jgi:hypothetical protein
MSARRVARVSSYKRLPAAYCAEMACPWSTDPTVDATEYARRHTRATGHQTAVVVEHVTVWAASTPDGAS